MVRRFSHSYIVCAPAQFSVEIDANLTPDSPAFPRAVIFRVPPVSVSSSCTFTCTPFAQTYLVSRAEPGSGPVSFSARPMGPGSTFAGDSPGEASLRLKSIALSDPATGSLIGGFGYSTDSGTQYEVNAAFVPEPAGHSSMSLSRSRKPFAQLRWVLYRGHDPARRVNMRFS